jgi:ELWxxDGT repeat protein
MLTSTLGAAALTCVAMFQAPRANLDDAIFATNGITTREVFDTKDLLAGRGSSWFFTNPGAGGPVLFSGYSEPYGRELWATNGLRTGTRVLKDIHVGANFWSNPGSSSNPASVPGGGTAYTTRFQKVSGNRIVFPATSAAAGRELWVSNGTSAGTVLLKDHMPGTGDGIGVSGGPIEFVFGNGTFAVYLAQDQLLGPSLWATNGSLAGTRHLVSFPEYGVPSPTGYLGNRILFGRNRERELWVTNGTAAGTVKLKTFGDRAIQNISRIQGMNYALLSVYTPLLGQELWITDGTAAGTRLLRNINLREAGSEPGSYPGSSEYRNQGAYFRVGNRIVFPAKDDQTGRELWATQGSTATTVRIANLTPGIAGSDFWQFATLNNRLYFAATVTEGSSRVVRPFVTDGTAAGTRKLSSTLRVSGRMVALHNTVVFPAYNPSFDQYIWRTGLLINSQVAVSGRIQGSIDHMQSVNLATAGASQPCPIQ